MRFCWQAQSYLLKTLERSAPPVGLNEDPNIYSPGGGIGFVFRTHKLEVRGGHKLFFRAKSQRRGTGGRSFYLFCTTFSNAVSIPRCSVQWLDDWLTMRSDMFGKKRLRYNRGIIQVPVWRKWTKPRKISVRTVGDSTYAWKPTNTPIIHSIY
jgi:hypothetical protein